MQVVTPHGKIPQEREESLRVATSLVNDTKTVDISQRSGAAPETTPVNGELSHAPPVHSRVTLCGKKRHNTNGVGTNVLAGIAPSETERKGEEIGAIGFFRQAATLRITSQMSSIAGKVTAQLNDLAYATV
jgi:hypothetical protein